MKIGVFGGGFNPIHNGHINLAKCYKNNLQLDKIIFVPTSIPPHKSGSDFASANDRISMIKMAIANEESFEVSDIEFKRQGKSYTYDTLIQLKQIYPNDDLYLIVGADQFLYFKNWYNYKEILQMVTLVTAAREKGDEYNKLLQFKNELGNNVIVSCFEVVVVSSSDIRNKIKNNQSISTLVNESVNNYIKDNKLYV